MPPTFKKKLLRSFLQVQKLGVGAKRKCIERPIFMKSTPCLLANWTKYHLKNNWTLQTENTLIDILFIRESFDKDLAYKF